MKVKYSPEFLKTLKKINVRICKSFEEQIRIFSKDAYNSQLNNHVLKREYRGCRSINVASDWRAIYQEIKEGKDTVAYFITLGTHRELYK
ncbi:MAG: hypothetical protein A3C22_02155 [Candidatus Levybacteria bacterium RIFCSPHIGHO2_02_FULL_37_10]|nr:MAG: hypothetical protein A3C22_02155 [Candidatus Levybacteria bacterium RIFCSPHIGHO2_02_FULL_37_10]